MTKIQIKLKIAQRSYPLTIAQEDEELVRRISKMLNEKIAYYKDQYASADAQDITVMAAIETLMQSLKNPDNQMIPEGIEDQVARLEAILQ